MRITAVPAYSSADLQFATSNTTPAMFARLNMAVAACVAIDDPLAGLCAPDSRLNDKIRLQAATDWLVQNAPFDIEAIEQGETWAAKYFLGRLAGDPRCAWMHNIGSLAATRIQEFYLQGWRYDNKHPVFKLVYEYVSAELSADYTYQPAMLDKMHWTLFVQAVVAQERLDSASIENISWAKAIVVGCIDQLITHYPVLGERDGSSYATRSCNPDEAAKLWMDNIVVAAKAYGELLKAR